MEHKAYVAQPASVRHQGKPFPTKDLRIGAQAIDKKSQTSTKADGLSCRTVARNSLKPAKKDREQEILLFPVLHPSPVPQPLPHEQRRGPSASEKPSISPALSSSPIKIFGKDGGSLRGEGKPFSKKVSLPPSFQNFHQPYQIFSKRLEQPASLTDSLLMPYSSCFASGSPTQAKSMVRENLSVPVTCTRTRCPRR